MLRDLIQKSKIPNLGDNMYIESKLLFGWEYTQHLCTYTNADGNLELVGIVSHEHIFPLIYPHYFELSSIAFVSKFVAWIDFEILDFFIRNKKLTTCHAISYFLQIGKEKASDEERVNEKIGLPAFNIH